MFPCNYASLPAYLKDKCPSIEVLQVIQNFKLLSTRMLGLYLVFNVVDLFFLYEINSDQAVENSLPVILAIQKVIERDLSDNCWETYSMLCHLLTRSSACLVESRSAADIIHV